MYKLLIVDDEPLVREGLARSICWEEIGFTVVGDAVNGADALKKIELLRPDALITDMRMGVMDGTELILNIAGRCPEIQLVIMTAYNEFAYAKTAIDHNVFAYISKPATNQEIIGVFRRLREKMDHDRSVQDKLYSYQSYRADNLLSRALFSPDPAHEALSALRECLGEEIGQSDCFMAQIEIDPGKSAHPDDMSRLAMILTEALDSRSGRAGGCVCKCRPSSAQVALLACAQPRGFHEQTRFLREVSRDFSERTGAVLTIGVSENFRSLSSIRRAYQQAQESLRYKSQSGPGAIIDYQSIRNLRMETPEFSDQSIQTVLQGLWNQDRQAVTTVLKDYFDSLKDSNPDVNIVKAGMAKLCAAASDSLFKNPNTLALVFGKNVRPDAELAALSTIDEVSDWVLGFLSRLMLYVRRMKPFLISGDQYSPIVSRAIAYIAMNYAQKIMISDIAAQLHISESRLIHIFKEETGYTINLFLTEYRIRLAEVMMDTSSYNLYDISELVGYKNPITFRKAFSKLTGTIPSKYRRQGDFYE